MALTFTIGTETDSQGPTFHTRVSFPGEASYVTAGSTGLLAALRAAFKDQRQIIGIEPQDCGGYHVTYNPSTDKLKVYWVDPTAGAKGPMPEVDAATDLHLVIFNIVVKSF